MKTVASHHTIIPVETLQIGSTAKGTTNPLQALVKPLLLLLKILPSIKTMKILQLNKTSHQTSHNLLKFYQEQDEYDITASQETNVKDKLEIFKKWKMKFNSPFTE